MFLGVNHSKKMPRLFLAQLDGDMPYMKGVTVLWPDRSESAVCDLSFAGIVVASQGRLGQKWKLGQTTDLRLKIEGVSEYIPLKVCLQKMMARGMCFSFETMSSLGRLVLEQAVKDRIVCENISTMRSAQLHPSLHCDLWLHGPFETNFLLWTDSQTGQIRQAIVEYDHLLWIYEPLAETRIRRSSAASEEAKGYFCTYDVLLQQPDRVAMGASWLDRLLSLTKAIASENENSRQLAYLIQLLQADRSH